MYNIKQDNSQYEFKALTISKLILAMSVWIVLFFLIAPFIEQMFNYDTIKKPSVGDISKVYGLILGISFILLLIINQFIISSKYSIKPYEDSIIILKNRKIWYHIPLENINSIVLKISNKPVVGFIQISHNNKLKLRLFNGFIFTFFKEKKVLEKIIIDEINPYFDNKTSFKLDKKENSDSITYIYIKK